MADLFDDVLVGDDRVLPAGTVDGVVARSSAQFIIARTAEDHGVNIDTATGVQRDHIAATRSDNVDALHTFPWEVTGILISAKLDADAQVRTAVRSNDFKPNVVWLFRSDYLQHAIA